MNNDSSKRSTKRADTVQRSRNGMRDDDKNDDERRCLFLFHSYRRRFDSREHNTTRQTEQNRTEPDKMTYRIPTPLLSNIGQMP
mmetsp:Transcript_62899/g.71214  ORF Transcript_62899/g.71214 Transcript_62899/m.71214 type:complete len:84 (-) Transcript_62899:2351-2602(-)